MPQYVEVPRQRLAADVLRALLEEYASRDGTDYGAREMSLEEKVAALEAQLQRSELRLLYEMESEQWDLVPQEQAAQLLDN